MMRTGRNQILPGHKSRADDFSLVNQAGNHAGFDIHHPTTHKFEASLPPFILQPFDANQWSLKALHAILLPTNPHYATFR
jgi:hypothetical protein